MIHSAPVINVKPTTNPSRITLLYGQTIMSTHTCNLNIPWLPAFTTEAHIVPGMAHSFLISIKKICNGGCKVIYDETEVRVIYNRKLVLSGGRHTRTNLWLFPITQNDTKQREKTRHTPCLTC